MLNADDPIMTYHCNIITEGRLDSHIHIYTYIYICSISSVYCDHRVNDCVPGPLFIKRTDVLPQYLVRSRSREIRKLYQSLWILTGTSAQRWWDACEISERYDHYNTQSRGFETSRGFGSKTSYRLANIGQGLVFCLWRNSVSVIERRHYICTVKSLI